MYRILLERKAVRVVRYGWVFVLVTLIFSVTLFPVALATGFGGAVYAHVQGDRGTRNLLLVVAFLTVAWVFLLWGLGIIGGTTDAPATKEFEHAVPVVIEQGSP